MASLAKSIKALRARGIFESLGLGLLAATLFSSALLHDSSHLEVFGSLVLFFSVVLMPKHYGLLSSCVFVPASILILKGEIPLELVRVSLFALIMASQRKESENLPPFVILSVLWALHLLAGVCGPNVLNEETKQYLPVLELRNASTLLVEISAVIIFGLLRCVKLPYQIFAQDQQALLTTSFLTHILALPVLILGLLVGTTAMHSDIINLGPLSQDAIFSGLIFFLCSSTLLVTLFGLLSGTVFRNIFRLICDLTDTDTRILQKTRSPLPLVEFRQTQSAVIKTNRELKKAKRLLKSLSLEANAAKEKEAESAKQHKSLEYLTEATSLGLIAVQLDGIIVSHNKTLLELIGRHLTPVTGQSYSSIVGSTDIWEEDISDALSWGIWRFNELRHDGSKKRYSREKNGKFLEITLQARLTETFANLYSAQGKLPMPHEAIIIASIKVKADLRKFQLLALGPSSLEMLGSNAASICNSHFNALSKIVDAATRAATSIAQRKQELGTSGQGLVADLAGILIEIDETARDSAAEVLKLEKKLDPVKDLAEPVNLSQIFTDTIEYFYCLTTQDPPPPIKVRTDLEKVSDSESLERLPISESDHIAVCCSYGDLTRFLSYVLCLLHSILPKAKDLSIELDYELIGSGTADIITGSLPGRYARIALSHSGKSIDSYMISSEISELDPRKSPLEDVESALCFLRNQIRLMGGFLSIQSSSGRGTIITVYLPAEQNLEDESRDNDEPDEPLFATTSDPDKLPSLILVTEDSGLFARMQGMFQGLSFEATQCTAAQAKAALEFDETKEKKSRDTPGYGKNREERLLEVAKDAALGLKTHLTSGQVQCVIFDVQTDDCELMQIAEELRLASPTARHIVFITPDDFEVMDFHAWQPLLKPLDFSTLEKLLRT